MWYVWLKYTWDEIADVNAIASVDWVEYKPNLLKVSFWDIFLCEEKDIQYYKYRLFIANPEEEFVEERFDGHGRTEIVVPTEQDKQYYFEKWQDFEKRRKILLHYLHEEKGKYIFGNEWLMFFISFESIFSWILTKHHEYKPERQVNGIDFTDILQSWAHDKYIRYYPPEGNNDNKVVILEKFFTIPEIEEGKKDHLSWSANLIKVSSSTSDKSIEIKEVSDNKNEVFNLWDVVSIDQNKEYIKIWNYVFSSFERVFSRFNIENKDARVKWKWAIGVIFGLAKYASIKKNQNIFECADILEYYNEFKSDRDQWSFSKSGKAKWKISSTDCITIGSVFWHCWISSRVELFDAESKIKIKVT